MKHLNESTVQDYAIKYLHSKYRFRAKGGRIFSQKEARVRSKYGGQRADGLIAFRHLLWGTYVVSMEAKSYKTLDAIKPTQSIALTYLNALKAGIFLCIISGTGFLLFDQVLNLDKILLPTFVFLIGFLLYFIFLFGNYKNNRVEVLNQIRNYPANEQWLACSKDSLEVLTKKHRNNLEKICRAAGIGMLVVNKRGGVEEWTSAKYRRIWFGDFLKFYSREKTIRSQIS